MAIGIREVEDPQDVGDPLAADLAVDGPAEEAGVFEAPGWAAHARVQRAGDLEDRVAPGLDIQPPAVGPPEPLVLRVGRLRGGVPSARLPVGARKDDLAMQGLQRPAAGDEAGGQVVEQFRVGRRFAELAEVARGRHQRATEVPAPDPVDNDPPCEGRRIPDDPVGELLPTTPLAEAFWFARRKDGREPPGDDRAGVRGIATEKNGEVS